MLGKAIVRSFVAAAIVSCAVVAQAVNIELVPVGNPGNPGDGSYGSVAYEYQIGKYEVTAGQYTEFLNAVAATDTHTLYNTKMWTDDNGCKIQRSNSPGSYTYSVAADRADRPVNFVTFWDAVRFANWLHNGQGNGDTESGAYHDMDAHMWIPDESGFVRQPGATWFIPSGDEWYKAAYHKNDGVTGNYFDYPTSSDSVPSNDLVEPTDPGNNATFRITDPITGERDWTIGSPYWMTKVGAHENSESPYGTFDQGGNVREWSEDLGYSGVGTQRRLRGGAYGTPSNDLHASSSTSYASWIDNQVVGFRVARIPEPGSFVMLVGIALMGLLCYAWRRRK